MNANWDLIFTDKYKSLMPPNVEFSLGHGGLVAIEAGHPGSVGMWIRKDMGYFPFNDRNPRFELGPVEKDPYLVEIEMRSNAPYLLFEGKVFNYPGIENGTRVRIDQITYLCFADGNKASTYGHLAHLDLKLKPLRPGAATDAEEKLAKLEVA